MELVGKVNQVLQDPLQILNSGPASSQLDVNEAAADAVNVTSAGGGRHWGAAWSF